MGLPRIVFPQGQCNFEAWLANPCGVVIGYRLKRRQMRRARSFPARDLFPRATHLACRYGCAAIPSDVCENFATWHYDIAACWGVNDDAAAVVPYLLSRPPRSASRLVDDVEIRQPGGFHRAARWLRPGTPISQPALLSSLAADYASRHGSPRSVTQYHSCRRNFAIQLRLRVRFSGLKRAPLGSRTAAALGGLVIAAVAQLANLGAVLRDGGRPACRRHGNCATVAESSSK